MSAISTIGRSNAVNIHCSLLIKISFPNIWEFLMQKSQRFYPRWRFNLEQGEEIKKTVYVEPSINPQFIWEAFSLSC